MERCRSLPQWFLLIVVLLVQACQNQAEEAPEGLIPEEKMARILTEIHLAEARVSRMSLGSQDSSSLVYKRLEKQIFREFKVDTTVYSRSYTYYSTHPAKLAEVYKRVTEELERRKKPSKAK
ncbi:DUF4296 domain-containing protein [Larkinella soli]|uniref:DUF4296 domain-containing protein n=1 Tax=Larkinella soli TaxID=1770527 RepID=UPI001E401C4B|nr:DUF4296 domain-containing protein [Larkinella soli]